MADFLAAHAQMVWILSVFLICLAFAFGDKIKARLWPQRSPRSVIAVSKEAVRLFSKEYEAQRELDKTLTWAEFFAKHYRDDDVLRRILCEKKGAIGREVWFRAPDGSEAPLSFDEVC